ncbi:suppressor of inhibitory function of ChpB [methanotrophic endosymbiont of Bathymodiolus azoricus (Menez Gwen)]|jgi:antitoxin component of MazEF toxin-antitoxin module|nr:suppressor of inhibitory function of ChpB [methanotrophic endosymbiont of Bathymodiolus azoricus (Menez Gwen)]
MQTLVRKIGNSTGMIIPANILKKYSLNIGDKLDIQDDNGRIVIAPTKTKHKYTLTQLLDKCDETVLMPQELIDWDNTPEVGNEKW